VPGAKLSKHEEIMKKTALFIILFISGASFLLGASSASRLFLPGYGFALADEDWRGEFDSICAKTGDSMELSTDELKSLISRCDKLKEVIGTLDESTKKVFSKRLQMCRDLFAFALEAKEKK
jgi:hypothetical protein